MLRRLPRRTSASGEVTWPAAPGLLEHYVSSLHTIFAAVGRVFTDEEIDRVRQILRRKLEQGFKASPFAKVTIKYHTEPPPSTALTYTISHAVVTIADEYDHWVKTRKPPLFGEHPDAKIQSLAASLGAPADVFVLELGAGTGRNALPLARAGHSVDAVELAPSLADILRQVAEKEAASVRVITGDGLDPALDLPQNHYKLVVLAEVVASHFRDVDQVRRLFESASKWLAPGGLLVFSAFLSTGGYKPEDVARELSEVFWCVIFTRREFKDAAAGLPLSLLTDESVYEYEKKNLPKEAWPPTGWFSEWARGQDLFDVAPEKSPLELRWLVYRKNESQE